MDIIGYTLNSKLGEKITSKKCMTERLMKGDENTSKNEGEIIIIGITSESHISDEKRT